MSLRRVIVYCTASLRCANLLSYLSYCRNEIYIFLLVFGVKHNNISEQMRSLVKRAFENIKYKKKKKNTFARQKLFSAR